MTTTTEGWTVNKIQEAMRARGSHWWDPGTMRSFGTRVDAECYQGPGGVFFVTSEKPPHERRRYSVRQFDPSTLQIATIGELCGRTREDAHKTARRLAAGPGEVAVTLEPYKPVSDLEQFRADLEAHGCEATQQQVERLLALAGQYLKIQEDRCNHGDDAYFDEDGNEIGQLAAVRGELTRLAGYIGCKGVIFSGDPRGATVKLVFADGATNDLGCEGWCVPTS